MKKSILRTILSSKDTLTDKLLKLVDDYEIYTFFLGEEVELGETIHSPIRSGDEYPSFALFVPTRIPNLREEAIWFKDLADGRCGDVFKFVEYYAFFHQGLSLGTRYEVIKFIDAQMNLNLFNESDSEYVSKTKKDLDLESYRKPKELYYQSRKFTKKDIKYWKSIDIEVEELEFFKVKSIEFLLTEDNLIRKEFSRNDLCFIYSIFDKDKLYQPRAPKAFKFRNTCPGDDYLYYQGIEQLSKDSKNLIITKSYKDVMVFWKYFNKFLNKKVDVIAPHAESINLSEEFVSLIKKKYDNIIVVSDFDLAGVKFANKCKKNFGFKYKFIDTKRTLINGKYKVLDKDISDFRVNKGKDKTLKFLSEWEMV